MHLLGRRGAREGGLPCSQLARNPQRRSQPNASQQQSMGARAYRQAGLAPSRAPPWRVVRTMRIRATCPMRVLRRACSAVACPRSLARVDERRPQRSTAQQQARAFARARIARALDVTSRRNDRRPCASGGSTWVSAEMARRGCVSLRGRLHPCFEHVDARAAAVASRRPRARAPA